MIKWFKKYSTLSDKELVELYSQKGDMNALGTVFDRYAHLVASIALNILKNEEEANDVTQAVFEVVARDLKTHDVLNFNNWLYSVTRFYCLKEKKKREKVLHNADETFEVEDDSLTEFELEEKLNKRVELMKNGLGAIKDHQKQCIELFYLKGKSYEEVSKETGFTLKEVKSYIQNGKRNLKEFILKSNG